MPTGRRFSGLGFGRLALVDRRHRQPHRDAVAGLSPGHRRERLTAVLIGDAVAGHALLHVIDRAAVAYFALLGRGCLCLRAGEMIASEGTDDRADCGGSFSAVAFADLVAEKAAGNAADEDATIVDATGCGGGFGDDLSAALLSRNLHGLVLRVGSLDARSVHEALGVDSQCTGGKDGKKGGAFHGKKLLGMRLMRCASASSTASGASFSNAVSFVRCTCVFRNCASTSRRILPG